MENNQNYQCRQKGCQEVGADRSRGRVYCDDHRCQDHTCEAMRSGETQPLCHQHHCAINGCSKEMGADSAQNRPYCRAHTCLTPGCTRLSRHAEYPAQEGSPYCRIHYCEILGCKMPALYWNTDIRMQYCEKIRPCLKTGCPMPQHVGGRFCNDHRECCGYGDCLYPMLYVGSQPQSYCAMHKCRYRGCRDCWRETKTHHCWEHQGQVPEVTKLPEGVIWPAS
ncbi:hypothetical protein B0T16DRAFT_408653 [Cercophora newfieldiana]|uniref:Uncharacterized protein n=1 Tax=Cercophora newfieldiana TaxID=92897 RepID=A0AA40CTG5_9PEZI|nr:hypothetical protein B0T16DRAFT_408653 [Cercophora newfieldiana]